MNTAAARVIRPSEPCCTRNRMRNTSAFLRKLSLNAEKNWVQNSGANRRDSRSGAKPDDMDFPSPRNSPTIPTRYLADSAPNTNSALLKGLFPFSAHHRQCNQDEEQQRGNEKAKADRAVDEDHRIAAGNPHSPAQVFLHERAEDEAQQHWGRLAFQPDEHVAKHPKESRQHDL